MKLILLFLSIGTLSYGQTDSSDIELNEVTVTANILNTEIKNTSRNITIIDKKMIEASPVRSVEGVLKYALNVDVRSRSSFGVQADISIRGGHYDQTLILLDGVKVNDPQTGHHALNIPIPFELIEKIEVLQGGASRVFGSSAFSGVINVITKKAVTNTFEIDASAGSFGTWNTGLLGTFVKSKVNFIAGFNHGQSDGFISSTQYKKNTVYGKAEKDYKQGSFGLSYGFMNNDFGASNFYHPKFNEQYEEVSSHLFNSSWLHRFSPKLRATFLANYRIHNDMYDFNNYRNTDKIASINFHQTGVFDAEWKFRWTNRLGKSAFGLEYRNEKVKSNRLGEELEEKEEVKRWNGQYYTHGKLRDNYSLFFEHAWSKGPINISFGTLGNYNSQFGFSLFPGLDIGYALDKDSRLYYSVNRSLRYPTFTELYLNTSTVVGDPNLKPEKAITQELGFKLQKGVYESAYSVFYVQTEDAIDKIKVPENPIPLMENIDGINRFGFETSHTLNLNVKAIGLKQLSFDYAWIKANKKEDGFQSFYTLNYLKHKVALGAFFEPLKNLNASVWFTFKDRAGQYAWDANTEPVDYGSFGLVDLRLSYKLKPFIFTLDANNFLDKKYYEYGFVEQAPRSIMGGVKFMI